MSGLVKGKDYDWQDSNLALFGSDLEKNIKKAAAETEAAWQGVEGKVGVTIWRIEKFQVRSWPQENYGSFYSGDSYIILNGYKEEEEIKYDVHFWIGRHSTQDEYGTAAYKTVELDTFLDDKPIQFREVQGYESDLFRGYFPKLEIWSGGIDSGFRHVKPEEYKTRLLHIRGEKKNIQVREVDLVRGNLNSEDCFLLDQGLKIWQFNGKSANKDEKMKAAQYVTQLKSERGKASSEVLDEADISSSHEFYKAIPEGKGSAQIVDSNFKKVLFKLSDASGKLEFTKVSEGKLNKGDLDSNDVFIVDTGMCIFVWVGSGASKQEKAKAMQHGHNYSMKSSHPFVPIIRLSEAQRNDQFNEAFDA